jgi:wyosine [tRNA(Phe)-imidazoG37] synthetase (radical SAM superfamily)
MLKYKYIYGPVNSWRLGRSLGIDPISSSKKICTFDCIYCQIGSVKPSLAKRKVFVPTEKLIKEFRSFPSTKVDYITFSGTGEPLLAKNLGSIIKAVKRLRRERIAVLTNSTLLGRKDIQRELKDVDLVEAKLDVSSNNLLRKINKPYNSISLEKIVNSIKRFKKHFMGKLALQIMLTKDNVNAAEDIAKIAKSIKPDEVHINTPLRPCGVEPVSKKEIEQSKSYFRGLKVISVYDKRKNKKTKPISRKETLKRRGKI